MKMRQGPTAFGMPDNVIFYDGQLPVDYTSGVGVVSIPKGKEHWVNELLLAGYEPVEETNSGEAPKRASTTRRKAKNG